MVKLRLARQGRKALPIYKIVAADSRSRRDGRFIEAVGQYRPNNETNKLVDLREDRIMYWLRTGAQPTTTVRALLSGEGILLKWHLEKKKIDPTRAEEIFNTWKGQRDEKLQKKMNAKATAAEQRKKAEEEKKRAAAEAKAAEERAAQEAANAAASEEPVAEAPAEEPAA